MKSIRNRTAAMEIPAKLDVASTRGIFRAQSRSSSSSPVGLRYIVDGEPF